MKRCYRCEQTKPLTDFSLSRMMSDGHQSRCKECDRATQIERRARIRELERVIDPVAEKRCPRCGETLPVTEFARNRTMTDGLQGHCKRCTYLNKQTPSGIETARDYARRYRESDHGKAMSVAQRERSLESQRDWYAKNKHKKRAHNAVYRAMRRGELIPQPCESCGATERVRAHHDSYDREHWLDVRWLCHQCHLRMHGDERRRQRIASL